MLKLVAVDASHISTAPARCSIARMRCAAK